MVCSYIQFVFGCVFFVFFWYQVDGVWFVMQGNFEYFFGCCYFQVQWQFDFGYQLVDILICDVMMIFVQVCGNVIGIIFSGLMGGLNWVWVCVFVGIVDGCDVIDIDVQV